MKGHTKLQPSERDKIAILKAQGCGVNEIVKRLKRSKSTISEELNVGTDIYGNYVAIHAQSLSDIRKRQSYICHPLKNKHVYAYVLKHLKMGWSPDQIEGRLKKEHPNDTNMHICHETIYRFIYHKDNKRLRLWEYLPRKQKKRKVRSGRKVHRSHIPDRVSIHKRPKQVDKRLEFGHWEGDTVEGRRSIGDGIHTEVERISRLTIAVKIDHITGDDTIVAQLSLFNDLPQQSRRSTTLDNGKEFVRHTKLRKYLSMDTYFCDPYSSWQRGTNEYHNGLIRRYLPKGTDFSTLTQEELDDIVYEINTRPRKVLQYATPLEVFTEHLHA